MRSGRKIVYWDSCIFIAWLKNEKRPGGEMDGVQECLDLVRDGRIVIVFSSAGRAEVRKCRMSDEVRLKFDRLTLSRAFQEVPLDRPIGDLAAEIMDFYDKRKAMYGNRRLELGDAQHLATAIHLEVDEFYTFDNGESDSQSIGLLQLSGNVAGHDLLICKPPVVQYRLPL